MATCRPITVVFPTDAAEGRGIGGFPRERCAASPPALPGDA